MSNEITTKEPSFKWLFKNVPTRPPKIEVGQIWSIFKPGEIGRDTTGQLVVVSSCNGEDYEVIPVHCYEEHRTILDTLLHGDRNSFDDNYPLVVAVSLIQGFGPEPFAEANFVGSIDDLGMEIITADVDKFHVALHALARVQLKDSYGEELTSKEEDAATKDGIYRLSPVDGDLDSLNDVNAEIAETLQLWHTLYAAQSY